MKLTCSTCGKTFAFKNYDHKRRYVCPEDMSDLAPPDISSEITLVSGAMGKSQRQAQPASDTPLQGDGAKKLPIKWGKYRIDSVIAKGGMGVVYKGFQEGIERTVAIKMLLPEARDDPRFISRLKREVKAMGKLSHPNIVAVHGYGEYKDNPFFTMDYVDGHPLDEYLKLGVVTIHERLALVRDACLAIEYAHSENILHRDLKPSNMVVTKAGVLKLLDFGLAKDTNTDSLLSIEGQIVGTPSYMSPEQAEALELGPPTDIYSLGAILYNVLTGHAPFEGKTALQTVYKVVHSDPKDPREFQRDMHPDLVAIVFKAMAKEPGARYPSAKAMAMDISNFLLGEPIVARPPSKLDRWKRKLRKNKLAALICGGTLVVSLIAILIVSQLGPDKIDALEEGLATPATRQASFGALLAGYHTDQFDDQERARVLPIILKVSGPKADKALKLQLVEHLKKHLQIPLVRLELAPALVPNLAGYLSEGPKALQLSLLKIMPHIKQPRPFDEALVKLLHNEDHELRCAAVAYCVLVPVAAAFKRLNQLFWDPHCGVEASKATSHMYDSGLMSIYKIGSKGLGGRLANLQKTVRQHHKKIEQMMNGGSNKRKSAFDVTVERLRNEDLGVRIKACYDLARRKEKRAIKPLLAAMGDKQIASLAAFALVKIKASSAVPALVKLLRHGLPETRQAAARALGLLGDGSVRKALKTAYDIEKDPAAKEALLEARERLLE